MSFCTEIETDEPGLPWPLALNSYRCCPKYAVETIVKSENKTKNILHIPVQVMELIKTSWPLVGYFQFY